VYGRARRRAAAVLARDVEAFAGSGYGPTGRRGELTARLAGEGKPPLRLSLVPTGGRIFGGTFALEVATGEPVLPATRGLVARGHGVVRLRGIGFRARSGDGAGARIADRLAADPDLARALSSVHFERIRVDPDGRAVIRHMGGALVWLLFPPMARPVPLSPEQARATVRALRAFANAGRRLSG